MAPAPAERDVPWWHDGVLYQIYPRSFADSNGDGVGDLGGVLAHLDHLAWLGIDGIWLSPTMPSPNVDWGYDVADYCDVDPDYGSLDQMKALIAEAGRRGIRVLLDLVPNHSSDQHPWFVDARSSRGSTHRDWYVWADPKPDGSLPNNWVSAFGGPAWTLDEASGQYYLHNFTPEQPDLNWWNDDVRRSFEEILTFWWDLGVAGFRIDVCHGLVKDAELRDNPPAEPDDPFITQVMGQRSVYNANRPEVHDVLRRWRQLSERYPTPPLLLGETNVDDVDSLVSFYGTGSDELHLGFNFAFIEAPFDAEALRQVVERTEELLPGPAWPVWTGSNHDVSRLATRWAGGDPARIRLALLMLLTLRGTPVLYQGDEIGMVDGQLEREQVLDPVGQRFWPYYKGRDPARTPMQWDATANGGFCPPTATPWLPVGDAAARNVAEQRDDPDSVLAFTRAAIALRRRVGDLTGGAYSGLEAPPSVWAWRRGSGTTVALNFGEAPADVGGVHGEVALGTGPRRDGEVVAGRLTLAPLEGVVVLAP